MCFQLKGFVINNRCYFGETKRLSGILNPKFHSIGSVSIIYKIAKIALNSKYMSHLFSKLQCFFFDFWSVGQNYPQLSEEVDKNFDHEKICAGHLIFKSRLLRKTHCFSLFKIH